MGPAHDHRAVGVVHHVVTDTAQDGAPDCAHPACPHHHHGGLLLRGHGADNLARLHAAVVAELYAFDLQVKYMVFIFLFIIYNSSLNSSPYVLIYIP